MIINYKEKYLFPLEDSSDLEIFNSIKNKNKDSFDIINQWFSLIQEEIISDKSLREDNHAEPKLYFKGGIKSVSDYPVLERRVWGKGDFRDYLLEFWIGNLDIEKTNNKVKMHYLFKDPSDIEAPLVRPYLVHGSRNSISFGSNESSREFYNYKWKASQTYLEDLFANLEVFDKDGNEFNIWKISEKIVYPKFDLTTFGIDFLNYVQDLNK